MEGKNGMDLEMVPFPEFLLPIPSLLTEVPAMGCPQKSVHTVHTVHTKANYLKFIILY